MPGDRENFDDIVVNASDITSVYKVKGKLIIKQLSMFSGIVEGMGEVVSIRADRQTRTLRFGQTSAGI